MIIIVLCHVDCPHTATGCGFTIFTNNYNNKKRLMGTGKQLISNVDINNDINNVVHMHSIYW